MQLQCYVTFNYTNTMKEIQKASFDVFLRCCHVKFLQLHLIYMMPDG